MTPVYTLVMVDAPDEKDAVEAALEEVEDFWHDRLPQQEMAGHSGQSGVVGDFEQPGMGIGCDCRCRPEVRAQFRTDTL